MPLQCSFVELKRGLPYHTAAMAFIFALRAKILCSLMGLELGIPPRGAGMSLSLDEEVEYGFPSVELISTFTRGARIGMVSRGQKVSGMHLSGKRSVSDSPLPRMHSGLIGGGRSTPGRWGRWGGPSQRSAGARQPAPDATGSNDALLCTALVSPNPTPALNSALNSGT